MAKEAQARLKINSLLETAGWRFFPSSAGAATISCEYRVGRRKVKSEVLGNDFEHAPEGYVDYLLLNPEGRPVALVEAKRETIDPLSAKEQARIYARQLAIRYVFLSNGNLHYFWDLEEGNPTRISHFLSPTELGKAQVWQPNPKALTAVVLDDAYIAVSQEPRWPSLTPAERLAAQEDKNVRVLRDYQLEAVQALQTAFGKGKRRFLFELATGTGKTLLSAAVAKLFIRSGNADRILFLVDRIELEQQAWKNFKAYLEADAIRTVIYKESRDNWQGAQVVVTTIQSLTRDNRYLTRFSPSDFQLIISDEAHRTIGGNNRVIFEYFIGSKLGLTATPRNYLRGIADDLADTDPRQFERRMLLDTYRTFGSDDGQPTYQFNLLNAVQHQPPYLVNPRTFDARTTVTTELLSLQGWHQVLASEDGEEQEDTYFKRDFEKKFFSPETNLAFIRTFMRHAQRDPLTGEIGKTILFAVSRRHATKLTQLLNEEAHQLFPGKYQSDFAQQITSDLPGAQAATTGFANNNLGGTSRFAPTMLGYETSRTRVCVTVAMMTTGYDCTDLLNVVLARPIFSPIDFIQIKGRGTRLHTFRHRGADGQERKVSKQTFYLFDFFANCAYFEHEHDYDERINLPQPGQPRPAGPPPPPPIGGYSFTGPDDLHDLVEEQIGEYGMRVDREYARGFENATRERVQQDAAAAAAVTRKDWDIVEEFVKRNLFNMPTEYWTTDKLREAYNVNRRISLTEILQKIFGDITDFKTREQLADEYFNQFLSVEGVDGSKVEELRALFLCYLFDPELRAILTRKQYSLLNTSNCITTHELKILKEPQINFTINYINDYISLNQFQA
ncbi:DEAD/DEAH box helicase family protein [Hymenobacter sp.]|jgi:type I restriction enzyme R subunit|uniref:DEAD/DEAH box helicase family protein n=1 Tax=Hymenobacter sp. TaxID=1898978 RepID=UPI002EDA1B79